MELTKFQVLKLHLNQRLRGITYMEDGMIHLHFPNSTLSVRDENMNIYIAEDNVNIKQKPEVNALQAGVI